MRVLAVTDRSSLVLALTMMVPDWDVDSVASADATIATDGYDCIVIEARTTGEGTRALAGLRRGGCAAPTVIVGDVGTDDAEASDGDGHVVFTRPFTIADLRDHITAMVDPMHQPDRPPEAPARAERRFSWRRTDGGTAAPHQVRPVPAPAAEQPGQATYSPPDDPVPPPGGPPSGIAGVGPTGDQPSPDVLEPPADLPEQQVPDPSTSAPVFSIVLPTDASRIDPLLLRTAAPSDGEADEEAGGEPVVATIDVLSESAPADVTGTREASGPGSLDPDAEAPADEPAATPRDPVLDGDVDVHEESADDEPEDEHAWSRMVLAELVNAFDPVTAAVWGRRGGGAWTSVAALGLRPAESQRSVPPDHPMFADVAQDLHGLLLSPADLARGYLAGIPGTWTEDIMAVGIGSRRGCDAIVVVGGDAYEKRDVRRLVALAAGATPSRSPGRRRVAELFQRH